MSVRDAVARRLHRWADRISDDEAMHHIGYSVTIEPGEGLVLHNTHGQISPEPEGCAIWVFGKDQPRMDPDFKETP